MRLRGERAIAEAADAARTFGRAQHLADDELARLCIVVEELVANLYDHGGVSEQDEVQLTLACDPNGIRVTIIDPGVPFDPWATMPAAASISRGGGAGTSLIRAWADFVSYRSSNAGNYLVLLLPVKREN